MLIQCCSFSLPNFPTMLFCVFFFLNPKIPFQKFAFLSSLEASKMLWKVTPTLNRISQAPNKGSYINGCLPSQPCLLFSWLVAVNSGGILTTSAHFQFSCVPRHHYFLPRLTLMIWAFFLSSFFFPPSCFFSFHLSINIEYILCTVHSISCCARVVNKTDVVLVFLEI